jgi:hypothetical protein
VPPVTATSTLAAPALSERTTEMVICESAPFCSAMR